MAALRHANESQVQEEERNTEWEYKNSKVKLDR